MPFPEILQSLMDANNISRYRLSKIIGCSQSTIKYWIDGATVPQNRTMQAIADASSPVTRTIKRNPTAAMVVGFFFAFQWVSAFM